MAKQKTICVLGGTGFVGHSIVRRLAKSGYRVKVLTRHRERSRDLLVLPTVDLVEVDIFERNCLNQEFKNVDAVINLVGILNELDNKSRNFQTVHVKLARLVVDACQSNKIKRLLHMSAMNADANRGSSRYLRSKGEAENIVHTTNKLSVTTFRPSVIFGPNDSFLNRFSHLVGLFPPFLPLPVACGAAKMQPIYVEDVSRVFVSALEDKDTFSQRYNLCGPKQYTLAQIVAYVATLHGRKQKIISLGESMSRLQSIFLGNLLTTDNILSLRAPSVCENGFPIDIFGFEPTSMESVAPRYVGGAARVQKQDQFRQKANR